MFFRGRINWLIIAMCSLKAILIGAKEFIILYIKKDSRSQSTGQ
jgi:hypothetical protein